MEIVIANDYGSVNGGSSFVAIASARALGLRGIDVTYFCAVGPIDTSLASTPNVEVICLDQEEIVKDDNRLRAVSNGVYNRSAAAAFRELLRQKSPRNTVVHVHTFTKALSSSTINAALKGGFRVVLTLHDFFITCPTGGFFVHKDLELCFRKPLSLSCLTTNCDRRNYAHKVWRCGRTIVQNHMLRLDQRISLYIGVSDHSLSVMRSYLPPSVPVTVIRNPLELRQEGKADVHANSAFTYVGRFSMEKGPLLMAQALRDSKLDAVFVGDGEQRDECEETAPEARFTGWLPSEEVTGYIRKARALVFPPLWYETLGLVVLEAAASGVPAIVSDRCAAADFVRDGETGLLFEHGSITSLRRQMERLKDAEFAAQLGANAYDWYWGDPWTAEKHTQSLLSAYRGVLC